MKPKLKTELTELDKLKYWIDMEFTILHVMFAILMLQLIEGVFWTVFFIGYIVVCLIYILIRAAYLAAHDPNYLKVPKQK